MKREVKIERVAINPFTLTLDIGGFHVRPTGSDRDDAGFEQFHANLELESLIRGGPVLKEIRLVAPQFRLVLLDSERNNWTDVIERLASGPDEEAGGTHFAINNIQLVDGRVELDDQVRAFCTRWRTCRSDSRLFPTCPRRSAFSLSRCSLR